MPTNHRNKDKESPAGSVWDPDLVAPEDVPILDSLRDLLTKARTRIAELETELEDRHRDEELHDRRSAALEAEIRRARDERKDAETRLRKAEARLRDRDVAAETLQRDVEVLGSDRLRLGKRVQELESDRARPSKRVQELESDRARLSKRVQELESDRSRLEKRIEEFEQQLEEVGDISRQRADLTARVIELEAQIEREDKERIIDLRDPEGSPEDLKSRLHDAVRERGVAEAELDRVRTRAMWMEQELKRFKDAERSPRRRR